MQFRRLVGAFCDIYFKTMAHGISMKLQKLCDCSWGCLFYEDTADFIN